MNQLEFYILSNQVSLKEEGKNKEIYLKHLLYTVPATRVTADVNQFAKLADIVLNLEKF